MRGVRVLCEHIKYLVLVCCKSHMWDTGVSLAQRLRRGERRNAQRGFGTTLLKFTFQKKGRRRRWQRSLSAAAAACVLLPRCSLLLSADPKCQASRSAWTIQDRYVGNEAQNKRGVLTMCIPFSMVSSTWNTAHVRQCFIETLCTIVFFSDGLVALSCQSSARVLCVPGMSVEEQKAQREAEANDIKEAEEHAAKALGVEWPLAPKRRSG